MWEKSVVKHFSLHAYLIIIYEHPLNNFSVASIYILQLLRGKKVAFSSFKS